MPNIIDTLHTSTVTENLSDTDIDNIAGLFSIQAYQSGEAVVLSANETHGNLSILANGNIKVKIPCGIGESTVCMLSPGDLVDLTAPANNANFYALGETNVLSMTQAQFDSLVHTHPMMMCQVVHGMMLNLKCILRRMNRQIADLSNYIYSMNGRN